LYVSSPYVISRIAPATGVVSRFTSGGGLSLVWDIRFAPGGDLYAANGFDRTIRRIAVDGSVSQFADLGSVTIIDYMAFDPETGVLYGSNPGLNTISRIGPNGMISVFASTPSRPWALVVVPEPQTAVLCAWVCLRRLSRRTRD
jgi:hypothetical protein